MQSSGTSSGSSSNSRVTRVPQSTESPETPLLGAGQTDQRLPAYMQTNATTSGGGGGSEGSERALLQSAQGSAQIQTFDNPIRRASSSNSSPVSMSVQAKGQDGEAQPAAKRVSRADCIKKTAIVVILLGIIVFIVVDSLTGRHVLRLLEAFLVWLRDAGAVGVIAFACVYMVAAVMFVPGSILTLGAGFAFAQAFGQGVGILVGSLSVLVGATAGATLSFLLARYALRDVVASRAAKYRILAAIDRALEGQGLKVVILLRLSPVIPFNAFNYVMGLTGVHVAHYVIGSVGMIPGTVAFVYFGSLLSDIKNAAEGKTGDGNPAVQWSIFAIGIVATVVAVVLITWYSKKQLSKHLDTSSTKSSPKVQAYTPNDTQDAPKTNGATAAGDGDVEAGGSTSTIANPNST